MFNLFNRLIVIIFAFISCTLQAENSYQIKNGNDHVLLADYQYLSQDNIPGKQLADIVALANQQWQQSIGQPVIYKGNNWLKFTLENTDSWQKSTTLLLKTSPYISAISLYAYTESGATTEQTIILNRNNLAEKKFFLPPSSQTEIYLNIHTDIDTPLLVNFVGSQRYLDDVRDVEFRKGIALGGYIILSLAMLLLFFAIGNYSLLLLCGYFASQTLTLFVLFGNNLLYFFPTLPSLRASEIPFIVSLSAGLLIAFTIEVFALKTTYLALYKQLRYTCIFLILFVVSSLFLPVSSNLSLTMLVDVAAACQLMYVGVYLMKQKVPLAKLYTISMVIQVVLGTIFSSGIFWHNTEIFNYSDTFLSVSLWINAFLLLFLVSRVFYLQIQEKHKAQRDALKSALENKKAQKKLLALQEENQEQLEIRVQERTLELNIAFQELEELNKELAAKSTQDELTGLYNRRYYDQKIQAEFRRSRRNLTPLSLIVVDVDHFKQVNDTMGHLAGDECLVMLGKHIQQSLRRSSDVSCRYGGEEFCMILPETTSAGAKALAEEIRQRVENNPVHYQGKIIYLTISCGFSTYSQQKNVQADDLFLAADKALYQAKHNGRNQIQEYNLDNLKV